ncbi:MAG: class I SAM-dependent methyltransferase [Myxococcota bacterium]
MPQAFLLSEAFAMPLISHGLNRVDPDIVRRLTNRVRLRGDTTNGTLDEQLRLIAELDTFSLGRWLLRNQGGLNAKWTDYLVASTPTVGELSCELERFLVYGAPSVIATRERFGNFQRAIQTELPRVNRIASVPCGRMADLLTLQYDDPSQVEIFGLDLDSEALRLADELARERGLTRQVRLRRADAWRMRLAPEFDLITTNGLSIYEPSEARVVELYQRLAAGLVPGGLLVTSYLTPPPNVDPDSPWDLEAVDFDALRLQTLIFKDICDAPWANYRSEATLSPIFEAAGLRIERTLWDTTGAFPTVLLRKV